MPYCLAEDCDEEQGYGRGNYCKDHTCIESDCYAYARSSSCCDEHIGEASNDSESETSEDITCENSDCDEDQIADSDYCYTHTCRWEEVAPVICRQPSLPDEEFCDKHADELCEDCEGKPKYHKNPVWLRHYCYECGEERATQKEEHLLQKRIDRVRDGEESPDEKFWGDLKHAKGRLDLDHPWNLDEH